MNRLAAIFFLGLISCSFKNDHDMVGVNYSRIDSTIIYSDTTIILGGQYRAVGTQDYILYILNSKGDTVLNKASGFFKFKFDDFNDDALNDLVVLLNTNVPGIHDLFLFDSTKMNFIEVKNFGSFPSPEPIPGTKYYFSYHRSGCADNLWDSDLFSINNFETQLLGNISGNECEGKKGIVVSRITKNKKKVVDTFTLDTLDAYDARKWGFIADYWTKNYSKFIE